MLNGENLSVKNRSVCGILRLVASPVVMAAFVLTACAVQVEIAPPETATPTPTPAAAITWHDEANVARVVASPRLLFSGAQAPQALLFMQPDIPDVVMLKAKHLWIGLEFDSVWFDSAQGNGRIRLSVYTRTNPEQPWTAYGSSERELTTASAPANVHDWLGVSVYPDSPGQWQVRTEVGIVAYGANGSVINPVSTGELGVLVLTEPEGTEFDPAALEPALGELDAVRLLFDWRGWKGGPCAFVAKAPEWARAKTQEACTALEGGDLNSAVQAITVMFEQNNGSDALEFRACMVESLSLLTAQLGNFEASAAGFEYAVQYWTALDKAVHLAYSLHNVAASLAMQGKSDEARMLFQRVQEIRAQLGDEPGRLLTQANLARLNSDRDPINEAKEYFEEHKLPQAAVAAEWIRQIDGSQ